MLFNVILGAAQQQVESLLISASTWSNCLSYCEGTGKELQSISYTSNSLKVVNQSLNYCFSVSLKDDVTGTISNIFIFDTYFNVIAWIDSQSGKSLATLSKQNKQFVSI